MVLAVASGSLFAQINNDRSISAAKLSGTVELQITNFEVRVSAFEKKIIQEPDKSFDESSHEQAMALQPLKGAIESLRWHQSNVDRKEKASLWLKVLAAIDRHLETNITSVSISGFIHPPPGYKGKVGINGMLPPDTNNVADYSYYIADVKANRESAKKALFLQELQRINDWQANPSLKQFIKSSYTASEADKKELNELLDQSKLSDSRKLQIHNVALP